MKFVPVSVTVAGLDPADMELGLMAVTAGTGLEAGPTTLNTCGADVPKPGLTTVINNGPAAEANLLGITAFRVSESTKLLCSVVEPA
jgi:hypothetical protein